MNEKQIIQALKICKLDTTCVTCPYYGKGEAESCFSRLSADALSVIHKQKKQINQLTHKHYNECGQIAKYSDELNQFVNADKKAEEPHCLNLPPIAVEQFMQRFCRGENNAGMAENAGNDN